MNLQKLISTRAAHRKVVEGQLYRITEDFGSEDISAILEGALEKIVLNENILSQTYVADIESEIIESEEFTIDMESKIRKIRRDFTHQGETCNDATRT